MGPGILPETTVVKHNLPCDLQMPNKDHAKGSHMWTWSRSAVVSCGPRLVENWLFQSGKVLVRQVQIWHSCWKSRTPCPTRREEGDLPACNQQSVQKPTFGLCMSWKATYGQLACPGRHNEFWKVYKGFRATYAPLQTTCISAGQCKTTYCSFYNSMAL